MSTTLEHAFEQASIPRKGGGKVTLYPELRKLNPTPEGEEGDCQVYPLVDQAKVSSAIMYLTRTRGWHYTTRTDKDEGTFTVWRREEKPKEKK